MKGEKQFPILLKVGVFSHVTTNVNQSHLGERHLLRHLLLDVHPPSAPAVYAAPVFRSSCLSLPSLAVDASSS